jgi:ferredoxin
MTGDRVSRGSDGGTGPQPQWLIEVDTAACTGSGLCVGCAPAYFELGPDHRSRAIRSVVDADDVIADAAECCPMEAIRVIDAGTGRCLHPEPSLWPTQATAPGRSGS